MTPQPATASQPAMDTRLRLGTRATYVLKFKRHDDLTDAFVPAGDRDHWSIESILELFPTLPNWPSRTRRGQRGRVTRSARTILESLRTHPGEGWQDRWIVSGADQGLEWINTLINIDGTCSPQTQHNDLMAGLTSLLLCRIVMPSYQFLHSYNAHALFIYTRQVFRPDLFAAIEARASRMQFGEHRLKSALAVISKLVLHTGRDVDQLTAEDLLTYRAWSLLHRHQVKSGLPYAWSLLREVADLGEHVTLKDAVRHGQRPSAELVDAHHIHSPRVRTLLIRYLDERRASLDYSTVTALVSRLVGAFWADIERHHPGLDTIDLPDHVAQAWKQRLTTVTLPDGTTRPRKDYKAVLVCIRGFYRDLQEWAHEDPSWAEWAVRNPVSKSDTVGLAKAKKQVTAEMHQRTRERLPHLPTLIDTAERHKTKQAAFLAAVKQVSIGQIFEHDGREYRRTAPRSYEHPHRRKDIPPDQVEDLAARRTIDVGRAEHDAFWAWAVIEVLHHTGVRVEELLEITHLALVSYQLPDTGEVVPMLQIVPSKANEERLLLISPELASVLASIITRLRRDNGGTVPLTARYDPHERVTGPPLPHLLQYRRGPTWEVANVSTIHKWLGQTLARTGLTDAAGQPLHYTPHDFRRMFTTEAVSSGLPVHIAARLLGHKNINTTQAYMAIFDEQLVTSYRAFLDHRRALRPQAEYREPTEEEWHEFQQHFQLRKVEIGDCGRPYGTPCKHEHACIRCSMLRPDPKQRPRLVTIIENLRDRIEEARLNSWLGEVQGLQVSLDAAANKLVGLDRRHDRQPAGPVNLGIPVITNPSGPRPTMENTDAAARP